jgi:hypothetical protein
MPKSVIDFEAYARATVLSEAWQKLQTLKKKIITITQLISDFGGCIR